ncbi:MAG: B12-binding domain-containing radical SAM protein [Phycisphaerae bacterium]|nr:B12-binding domain-containing radical SAM protein [Phycisphaerae bacterium]
MRVLFIYPNLNAEEGFNHGIAVLSGELKARGHETGLININEALYDVPSDDEVVERVRAFGPDLVAFSAMSQQYPYALRLARAIRAGLPEIPLAVGGVHTLLCTERVKADGVWDFIGVGECDEALPELVDRLGAGDPTSREVPNFCIRLSDGSYRQNPLGPYPRLECLASEDYEIYELDHMLPRKNGWQSILTSRGCPFRCSYCFNREMRERYTAEAGESPKSYLRHYPPQRVVDEIIELRDRHPGVRTIIFDDDLLTMNREYCIELFERYAASKVGLPFVLNAHVQAFNDDVAAALRAAGCMIVKFGVESGSNDLRRNVLKRYMGNDQIAEAFEICRRHDLHSSAFLMIGLPFETRRTLDETIDLMVRVRPGRMRWAIFYPFQGTESYAIAESAGLIDEEKMRRMENYFCASCLRFDEETDLLIRKLQRTFHWFVNARGKGPAAREYRRFVDEVESWDLETWLANEPDILSRDRRCSDDLLARNIPHYSIRYTEVMAVDSSYVLSERGQDKHKAVRTWKA